MVSKKVAAVGGTFDIFSSVWMPILTAAGIPVVPYPIGNLEYNSANSFPVTSGTFGITYGYAAIAKQQGYTKLGFANLDIPQAKEAQNIIVEATKNLGLKLTSISAVATTATDYSSYVAANQAGGTQITAMGLPETWGAPYLVAVGTAGVPFKVIWTTVNFDPAVLSTIGQSNAALKSLNLVSDVPPPSAAATYPAVQQYVDDVTASGTKIDPQTAGLELGWYQMVATADVIAKESGTVTAASTLKEFETVKDVNVGFTAPWTPSTKGPTDYSKVSEPYEFQEQLKGSEFVLKAPKPLDFLRPSS